MAQTNYTNLFATPLMVQRWDGMEGLNAELREAILAHRAASPGVAKTNVGGWHSETGLLEFCGEAGGKLAQYMRAMADEATRRVLMEYGQALVRYDWTLSAWANVNGEREFNRIHTHPGATWSGAYYVDLGVEGDAAPAPLQLFDPCQGRANTFLPPLIPTSFTLRPEPGMMVIFPSYIAHMVFPHSGPRPRISIAFNARREPFP